MDRAGDIIENPITGERIAFFETARDTGGELLRLEQDQLRPEEHQRTTGRRMNSAGVLKTCYVKVRI